MPRLAGEPITKVTLNLFTSDVIKLRARYPYWTEKVRDLVRQALKEKPSRTVEDYLKEDLNE